jgi:excisionase family DNA binding protein
MLAFVHVKKEKAKKMKTESSKKGIKDRLEKLKEGIDNLPPEKIGQAEKLLNLLGKKVLSIREVSGIFGLSFDTIRRAIKTGTLKAFQLNNKGHWKIPIEEVERFMRGGK